MTDNLDLKANVASQRDALVAFLHRHVVGPFSGLDETLSELPHKRYLMGTLYAENARSDEVLVEEQQDPNGGTASDELADDPVTFANSWLPSSLGVSFFFTGRPSLRVGAWAARYEARPKRAFGRVALAEESSPVIQEIHKPTDAARERTSTVLFDGRASVDVFWRLVGGGFLVTVVLRNRQQQQDPSKIDAESCLHQVGMFCEPVDGMIREYPSASFLSRDEEEGELRLLHRGAKTFAIGHGCAAGWLGEASQHPSRVRTELLPRHEVPAVVAAGSNAPVLRLSRLADPSVDLDVLQAELNAFVDEYDEWIGGLVAAAEEVPSSLRGAAGRVIERLRVAVTRMRHGVRVLSEDSVSLRAFRLANHAMLTQMRRNETDLAGTKRARNEVLEPRIDYSALTYAWRPFQLAFQLLVLPSVLSATDDDRDIVDLLWFPTGGGKTEAYLAVAAMEIFSRRLRYADGGAGTTVITRYTLRLLSAQQFQRAAALICACEVIRRDHADEMGESPITIGLWVGDEVAPNRYGKAYEKMQEAYEAEFPLNSFQLEQCPWCGTSVFPHRRDDDTGAYGVRSSQSTFEFFCPTASCLFHDKLPVAVVDDDLYENPPTFLLGTVDKFARLAWEERAGAFFGGDGRQPPSLIIQDEMHLLSGPLGTTMAVYEGAIEALMAYRGGRPKILASTATIRRANDQSWSLFGRKLHLFPPPGLDASDSYYAKADPTRAGRLYVGLMSQSHTPHTTTVHVAAALLQAPVELHVPDPLLDAYWTLVAYHNSLRELGRTLTLARDDIPARVKVIAHDQSRIRELNEDNVVELTGNVGGAELPGILARLKSPATQTDSVSLLASTNMLSVGVDVPRLALMLMNGQPKTTSEYIQATSRVGRSQVPGLVVTLYVSTKPRDRSHYEGFGPYHAALYRYVEPTSVTPFSPPSRDRALHAALVVLVRHGAGLSSNDSATDFRVNDPEIERAIASLEDRVRRIDGGESDAASAQLRELAADWQRQADEAKADNRKLYYAASKPHSALLQNFGDSRDGWDTLHSMRNVDRACALAVVGEDR